VKISGLKEAINKHTGHISGAFTFILDGMENEFLFSSKNAPVIMNTILRHHGIVNFNDRTYHAKDNICQLTCDEMDRLLIIKKLANNLFLGICIPQEDGLHAQAMKALSTEFKL
jgi:hypothetical protein